MPIAPPIARASVSSRMARAFIPLMALTLVVSLSPPELHALGAKESGAPLDDNAVRLASAAPYDAPADTQAEWAVSVPPNLGPAPDGAFRGAAATTSPVVIDVERAVELALANNVGLASGRIDAAARKRKVDTAWNVFLPTVDVSGTFARPNTANSVSGFLPFGGTAPGVYDDVIYFSQDLPRWALTTSLSAQLALNLGLFEGMRNLKLDYEAGLITYAQAKTRLERDVRKAYYSILLLQDNISIMEETLAAAEKRARQADANYRAGQVPELSMLQARVAAENLKPAVAEMRNGLRSSLAAFAMNLGFPRGVELSLEGFGQPDFIDLEVDAMLPGALARRLDVQGLVKSMESLESARKLMFFQLYTPTLALGLNFDPTFQGDPWKDSWFMDDGWKQGSGMFRATLTYRLNGLLPFSGEAQGLVDMDENIEKLRMALAQTVRGMETEIDSIVLQLDKSSGSIATLALNVQLAERAYRLSEESYRAGGQDILEVQSAELELRKARNEVLKEKFNYMTGLLDLEYALGVPFGTLGRNK
jgi:outer membrane protein TolC